MDFRVSINMSAYTFESITADNGEQAEKIALERLKEYLMIDLLNDNLKIKFIETTDNNEIHS